MQYATQYVQVSAEYSGQRLDNYLIRHLKGVPKTHVYRIIRSGEVRINKKRCQADTRIQTGDTIRIPPVRLSQQAQEGMPHDHAIPPKEFDVLLEDNHLIAINKPAGVAVHGGSGVSFGVIEQMRRARPQLAFLELVHRLDKETSGILLLAKRRSALVALQDQFRHRRTGKTYLALVCGHWPQGLTRIQTPLRKYLVSTAQHPEGERRVRATGTDDPHAMPALSLIHVLRHIDHPCCGALTLLAVTIKTGRTHQIRVHLAHAGYPIAGDEKYGDFQYNRTLAQAGLKRMFLHAWRLRFVHPHTQQMVQLEQDVDSVLAQFIQ